MFLLKDITNDLVIIFWKYINISIEKNLQEIFCSLIKDNIMP